MSHRVYWGDARRMDDVADESVHLIVTSPPYWQLKDYGASEQIGFHQTLPEYLQSLREVWRECWRVLHEGCRMCVNIGDQFARAAHYGRYKVVPLHAEVIVACEAEGFDFMGSIIWQKSTTMNTSGGGSVMGSFPLPRNGIVKLDYEHILLFKKLGVAPKPSVEQKSRAALSTREWNEYFNGHWRFAGERQSDEHIAMFPVELPRRLIRMFSFPGERVLDPFLGSGTTLRAAMELDRAGTGYEINPAFEGAMRARLGLERELFAQPVIFQQSCASSQVTGGVAAVVAPLQADENASISRQVDSRQFRFNSVIRPEDRAQTSEIGQRISEVVTPNRVRLRDGGEVHLLGVAPLEPQREAAMNWLREVLLKRPVFLRFDEQKHTTDGALLAYLYLENKTFINAKLIKMALASADPAARHRHAARFLSYEQENQRAKEC